MPTIRPDALQDRAPVLAILSERAGPIAALARDMGLAALPSGAGDLWLMPVGAPDIVLLDLPIRGVSDRRLSLLLRQLNRACADLVIILCDPENRHPFLPRDIDLADTRTDEPFAEALAEARHLLRFRDAPHPLRHRGQA